MRPPHLLFCFVGLCFWTTVISLKICAFNIQSYGEAKAHNRKVMEILIKIISRCDLSLIQEVRDSRGEAISALLKNLNRFDTSHIYTHLESKRMGKKTYKEQYVYIYRKDLLQVQEQYHYSELNETAAEEFSREPFIIWIRSHTTLVKNFVLIGQHTCPKNAMKEMETLYDVFQAVRKKWKTENVMFLGDLNAACNYVTNKALKNVRLRSDPKFHWLIRDEQDTSVRDKTHCAYDRIIIHGKELISGIVPESAQPFNFKQEFNLSEEEALEVSDHYPVEVDLKPNHRYLLRHEL
ncbi:deoxyribonuclease gamma-like [Myxocyprinus asiaticus]|uniref:deoxyribonuclease gamma-like n=1 Tax=Myxocyprinus asiaticus TaxID=70543 RepID=UPI002221E81B|nr:deoxyribonuclease gamma-like [Myxocyprinus asiaticus]